MPSAFGVLKSANAVAQERARSKYTGNAARLDAYATPPTEERSIDYLERCASDRYALLRAIDDARSGGKKDEELRKVIREEEERREMRRTNGRGEFDEENASRDATGHFLLRLASSLKEEHERWFVENELELFKYRFGELSE